MVFFQWLEDARRNGIIPRDADQYNAIQERLISRFSELYPLEWMMRDDNVRCCVSAVSNGWNHYGKVF